MKKLGVFQEHPIFLRPLFLKKYPPTGLVRGSAAFYNEVNPFSAGGDDTWRS